MNLFELVLLFNLSVFIILFLPDLLPKCELCRFYKPRLFFKIHRTTKSSVGYRAIKAVCSKCCTKYKLYKYEDYLKLIHSKKIAKINLLKIFHNW